MKATVTKRLNRRLGSPSVNAPKLFPLEIGTTIEVVQTVTGDMVDGNNTWYKTAEEWYVWSGGVKILADQRKDNLMTIDSIKPQSKGAFDLLKLLQLNSDIKGDGSQITISVLDTGIFPHRAIKDKILLDKSQSFIESDSDARDYNGHGTKVASIIAGNCQEIKGIATGSRIINYKVISNSGHVDSDALYFAIKHIAENELDNVDIINMSLDINNKLFPYLLDYIKLIQSRGIILVVAAGNNNDFNNITSLNNVIKVGAIDVEKFSDVKNNALTNNYHTLYVNQPIFTSSINNTFDYIGSSSAYTAVTTGIIAGFLSDPNIKNIPKQERFIKTLEFLKRISFPLTTQLNPEPFKLYKP